MQNNAFAAKKVVEDQDRSQAAIASSYAGEIYGLEVKETVFPVSVLDRAAFDFT